jgi:hypothetical protein
MERIVHISRVKRDELAVAEEKRLRRTWPIEGFTGQPPKLLNRPKIKILIFN